MEFSSRINEVLDPVEIDFFSDRSRTPSPTPVLTSNVCCDLEDILSDAISESLQGSLRVSCSQLINQELTIRPEANIESNVPEGLDLYTVIYEVESDSESKMADVNGPSAHTSAKDQDACRHVGGSKFYEVMEGTSAGDACISSPTEKQDPTKPTESDDEGCFAKAFERIPRSMASSLIGDSSAAPSMTGSLTEGSGPAAPPMQLMHVLECSVDIKETDAKGSFSHVPKERLGYKLRGGIDKQVTINVKQVTSNVPTDSDDMTPSYTGGLYIERCFGILLAPGRSVKHSDMQLLEMVSGASGGSGCSVCALWNAGESALAAFNVAGGDGAPAFMSMALDLVIRGIRDPLRLVIETPVKVYPPSERFWYYSKRPLVQQFYINLRESVDSLGQLQYEVASVETSGELDRSRLNLPLSLSSLLPSPLSVAPAPPSPLEADSDGDEPLLSGTGEVSKDCGEDVLENWAQVLRSWVGPRPRALGSLVRAGVPEALRGEVWLRLADVDQNHKLMETYRTLISKDCPFEAVIQRDIARTFPAHDFFREAGGLGQDSLLRMARAYAVYDHEVGYCQGLSFLAATLLLHMPEEQAFCLLVRLMYGYGLRELYKDGFEALYMRLHQLDRLMEEQLSDLRAHFQELGVEPHMFASQWFLTVFTARFPLPLVYHILDVFLLQGVDTLFQVSLALLTRCKKDLMQHDFEGVLKYFRVTLPKKCRAEESSRQIVKLACGIKVKRLQKYQLEYEKFIKESAEEEKINVELERLKAINAQLQQDKDTLEKQLAQSRNKLEEAQKESSHHSAVARDYREICERLDRQLHHLQDCTKSCVGCSLKLAQREEEERRAGETEEKTWSETEARLKQRVRELELELAQVKLAHVQAQCSNQELSHRLNSALNEMQSAMNQKQAVTPWLVRTLGSIVEAAQSRPSFQTYLPNSSSESTPPVRRRPRPVPRGRDERRVSEPRGPDAVRRSRDPNVERRSSLVELDVSGGEESGRSCDATTFRNPSLG
ncbi:rab GTPase-activating protein 1-like isoform X5 [Pieris brassicae]|uniref:rab GTPase-activating protein 1-like isoform X5 n=1 Tax=Pieris brassicae TaxID=7116 RepID=UPI001E65EEB9|nr:rab GTPase-activating protein 1-like isoform X5 [Pieris brassicae]